jgi:hypothetical protein
VSFLGMGIEGVVDSIPRHQADQFKVRLPKHKIRLLLSLIREIEHSVGGHRVSASPFTR